MLLGPFSVLPGTPLAKHPDVPKPINPLLPKSEIKHEPEHSRTKKSIKTEEAMKK